jgi:hypothetical protein
MEYRVIALGQDVADEVRRSLRAPEYGHPAHVETASGTGPCRLCLRPFEVDEDERVLFTYNPFPGDADLPAPGPVFVHKEPCARFDAPGFPPGLRAIPVTVEGYDERGLVVARMAAGEPDTTVREVLSRAAVAYAHLRNSEAGCFIARVERR